jgi:hypothetical protein
LKPLFDFTGLPSFEAQEFSIQGKAG